MTFLMKIHTKLTIMTDKQGKIPVKSIVKAFAQNKEDRKKVEKALVSCFLIAKMQTEMYHVSYKLVNHNYYIIKTYYSYHLCFYRTLPDFLRERYFISIFV